MVQTQKNIMSIIWIIKEVSISISKMPVYLIWRGMITLNFVGLTQKGKCLTEAVYGIVFSLIEEIVIYLFLIL